MAHELAFSDDEQDTLRALSDLLFHERAEVGELLTRSNDPRLRHARINDLCDLIERAAR